MPVIREFEWGVLSRKTDEGKCTPFIGPQVDGNLLPTPEKTAKEWAEKYNYPLEDSDVLSKVAQYLELRHRIPPRALLSEELMKIEEPNFDLPEYENSPYAILAELPCPIYITTNYDNLMEKALKDKRRSPVSEFCRWDPQAAAVYDGGNFESVVKRSKYSPVVEKPLVYHLHGVQTIPESMVLTEKDYINFIVNLNKIDKMLPPAIETALSRTSLMFIGYSLEDIAFRVIFQGISILLNPKRESPGIAVQLAPTLEKSQHPTEGTNLPNASDEKLKLAQEWLSSYSDDMYKVLAYWGTSSQFLQELSERWNKFRATKVKQTTGM